MSRWFSNRVWCDTATLGTGNVTIGAPKGAHCTPADAGTPDGAERTWLLEEGDDFEIFRGVYTTSGTVVSRGTVLLSQIASVTGTTRLTLAGTATIREVVAAEDLTPKKNRIVNGAMMVSEENGSAAGTVTAFYAADQFKLEFSHGGTPTAQQVASVTPGGSPNRIRITATVADAAVAAADYCIIYQRIEGYRVADLMIGTPSAKTITIRFGVKAPAGTYSIAFRNNSTNRGYAAEYTISGPEANTDVVKSVTIALDQAGTWQTGTSVGLDVIWCLMNGTTYAASAGSWQAANIVGSTNQFNFMGTAGNVFELFDVSLTEGAVAHDFVVPDYVTELQICQRYWEKGGQYASAISSEWANVCYKATKRVPATVTTTLGGTVSINASGTHGFHVNTTAGVVGFSFTANARM